MRFLLALLILSGCLRASGAVRYEDANFSLALGGDWTQVPLRFVDHVAFRSESLGLHVKILAVTERARPERMRLVATKMLEELIRREVAWVKPEVKVTVTHQEVTDIEGGVEASYRGYDTSGRAFLTIERIYPSKGVLMFFEAPTANARNLDAAASEVLRGLFK